VARVGFEVRNSGVPHPNCPGQRASSPLHPRLPSQEHKSKLRKKMFGPAGLWHTSPHFRSG